MTNDNEKILPEEPNMAIQKMIELAEECLNILQAESDRMTINDMVKFTVSAAEKDQIFDYYAKAAAEFKPRVDELQGKVDPSLVTKLQQLQLQIGELAQANNERIHGIFPDADKG